MIFAGAVRELFGAIGSSCCCFVLLSSSMTRNGSGRSLLIQRDPDADEFLERMILPDDR